ncbi:MAG: ATP-binding protein [Succinimonas sp.]|nr:ATP-binding protein [Succinimonas sp.]
MDRDDAFLKELQVNDKVKLTVNFFGQEMPFEGTCTGITDDKLNILTSAKPEPIELPFSAIIEGTITSKSKSKNKINTAESAGGYTYENIEINFPQVVYGYYIVDLNNEPQSTDCTNNTNNFTIFDTPTAILLSLREYSSNTIISKFYNSNAYHLKNIKTFNEFYKNNKGQNKDIYKLYNEYMDSLNIFINNDGLSDNEDLLFNLKIYLDNLACLEQFSYGFPFISDDSQSFVNEKHLQTIINLLEIIIIAYIKKIKTTEQDIEQDFKAYLDTFFKSNLILKLFFNFSFCKNFNSLKENVNMDFLISYITLFSQMVKFDTLYNKDGKLDNLLDDWYKEQIRNYNLFNPDFSDRTSDAELVFDKPVLIPLLAFNKSLLRSTKYELIRLLYTIYISKSKLLYIRISDNELNKNISNYIKIKHGMNNDLNLSIKTLFIQFAKTVDTFFLNIIKICTTIINLIIYNKKDTSLQSTINASANIIIKLLDNEASKYITITTEFNKRLKLFFRRIAAISSPVLKLNFSKDEDQLLLNYQNCFELIKESNDEVFSDCIKFYLDLINIATHTEQITIYFYSKFDTVINISVIKNSISFNTELHRIFIPLDISSSKNGQTSYIIKICTQSSLTDKTNEDVQSNVKLLSDGHLFYLAELHCTDFDSVLNSFDITITLEYKFKTAWDFEKCEATWETREITETFLFQDELKNLTKFHEIRNLFRDYSSGSVIKDDRMFFGRDQDIRHVIENIRDESGRIVTNRCVCIYGQTRTGKSSLLYHIKKGLRSSPSNIIVDIGDIGSAGASEAGIKYRILSCLLEEIELEHEDIFLLLTDSGISITADPERNKTDESYFTEQIGKIRSILKRKAKDTQIIILIDEFTYVYDWIKEKKLSENFMKFWKAFITNYDICAIIVGQDHMMKFINDQRFTNAFGAIRTWEVNYLKEPDACKLVTMPVSDSPDYAGQYGCTILPEAVNLLVEMTSGSAYLLMNICADFIDYLNERHAPTATCGHAEDFLRRNISKFEERWFEPLFNDKSDLDSDTSITANKELLKKLALSYSEHSGILPDEISLTAEEKERLQSLEDRRVVEMKDGRWRITVRLYAEWLRNKFGSR